MKNRITDVVGLALLLVSIAVNVWQYQEIKAVRQSDRQRLHIPSVGHGPATPENPVLGLTQEELAHVVQNVVSETKDASEQRILSVEKLGHDNVVVRTGSIQGPLAGQGYVFRFRRINDEWVGGKESNLMWRN